MEENGDVGRWEKTWGWKGRQFGAHTLPLFARWPWVHNFLIYKMGTIKTIRRSVLKAINYFCKALLCDWYLEHCYYYDNNGS